MQNLVLLFAFSPLFCFGYPPYSTTGVRLIDSIYQNYLILKDTVGEVIAPLTTSGKKTTTQQMTMKWNIKIDPENLTNGLIPRHS
ncbi:MAG: hypothetical protein WCP32_11400 [Bacteroidota bacterium]